MAKTFTTLFSGLGGVDLGLIAAGFEPCESVEYDPQLAELHKANIGGKMHVMDILDCDPYRFEKPDILHASPVCKSYSTANAAKGEKQLDIDCARKVAEFIQVLQPPTFTLENVQAYAKDKAFNIILEMLYSLGYWVNYQILNACDFGVPQSRRRLILIAVKDGFIPALPHPEKHIGWYEAIADKVHDLPDSKLADWQLKALPSEIKECLLMQSANTNSNRIEKFKRQSFPSDTIDTSFYRPRAILVNESSTMECRQSHEPSTTQVASPRNLNQKAILIENTGARSDRELQTRAADEPCWTLRAMGQDGHYHRANALLIHPTEQRSKPYKHADEPCHTILANQGGGNIKALLENAKIKALDIACLARLQSFPDDYIWSGKKSLDGMGIGNSVPPLMMEKIARSVLL